MLSTYMKRINVLISRVISIGMVSAVTAMAILIMLSVIVRNLLGFSFQWIVDVNRLIFVWMCFTGIVYINEKNAFIRFDMLEKRFSPAVTRYLGILFNIGSLALFVIMIKSGMEVSAFAQAQVFSTIPVSTSWLYAAVVFAGILLTIQTSIKIALDVFFQVR